MAPGAPASGPAEPADPTTWVDDPLAGVGMSRLANDPPGVVVPPGAVRHSGFRRRLADGAEDIITYVHQSDLPAVEAFYRSRLAEAGYRLAPTGAAGADQTIMVFLAEAGQVYRVVLKSVDNGKKVKIVLVIARPGQPGR